MATFSASQKRVLIQHWANEAIQAGIPLCQYLQEQAAASLEDVVAGGARLIQSSSEAGHSASYVDPSSDPLPQSEAMQLLAAAAELCPECTGTDEEKVQCLKDSLGTVVRYRVGDYCNLRNCGC
jgi:hypothetical protein